jgi:hypothetical protein
MATFNLSHDIHCDIDKFWNLYFDDEFNRALYHRGLNYAKHEVLEFTREAGGFHRRVQFVPNVDVPGVVAKLIGPAFSCVEDGTFDRAARTFRWKLVFSTLSDKVHTTGVTRVEASGAGRCRRVVEVRCEANVFAIGGIIESALESNLRGSYDRVAAFINDWLATSARPAATGAAAEVGAG